jgi:hypothetical protein
LLTATNIAFDCVILLQVSMLEPVLVSGISIQGDLKHSLWVTSLYVTYSLDCDIFIPFTDEQYMVRSIR